MSNVIELRPTRVPSADSLDVARGRIAGFIASHPGHKLTLSRGRFRTEPHRRGASALPVRAAICEPIHEVDSADSDVLVAMIVHLASAEFSIRTAEHRELGFVVFRVDAEDVKNFVVFSLEVADGTSSEPR